MEKVVGLINWIFIAILAFLVILETLNPSKGGDAAGRGIGQAIYFLAIIALVVLLILNLLPFKWTKYAGLLLILMPFIVYKLNDWYKAVEKKMDEIPVGYKHDKTPWFSDPVQQQVAIAAYNADVEKVRELLPQLGDRVNNMDDGWTLLSFLAMHHNGHEAEKRLEIMRMFFDAGAKCIPADMHIWVAKSGNVEVLKLLIEHGADPNAIDEYLNHPVLFEAINATGNTSETVQILLDAGADPNAKAVEGEEGEVSALMFAATRNLWKICSILIAKGADINHVSPTGKSFRALVKEADKNFTGDNFTTREDYEQLKAVVQK